MAKLEFETLRFEDKEEVVEVTFLKLFVFELPKDSLENCGGYSVGDNYIDFIGEAQIIAENRFNLLLARGFENLKNKVNGKDAVYVHKFSGIPLIGNIAFGLVDRNTNIIEVKPITVCNLRCIYCSVNDDTRPTDFVVEKDYLVDEFRKIAEYKECDELEAHIGGQAEPMYYADIIPLVKGLASIKGVKTISIDTNCTMLTKTNVDALIEAGLTRFNLSINALDFELAEKIAGTKYDIHKALEIAEYISTKADLILAPVWMPGINDEEMPKIIEFGKKLKEKSKHKVIFGIQNFLNYKFGRNPVKQMDWEEFKAKMENFEKKYDEHLLLDFKTDFNIKPTKPLLKPFKKGSKISAEIKCEGRIKGERIAVSEGRTITLPNCEETGKVKIKITRSKHNIFYGVCL